MLNKVQVNSYILVC